MRCILTRPPLLDASLHLEPSGYAYGVAPVMRLLLLASKGKPVLLDRYALRTLTDIYASLRVPRHTRDFLSMSHHSNVQQLIPLASFRPSSQTEFRKT